MRIFSNPFMLSGFCVLLGSTQAYALHEGGASISEPNASEAPELMSIGKLNGELTCTASAIKTSNTDSAPLYLISNGHCALDAFSYNSSNQIIVNQPTDFLVQLNIFKDSLQNTIPVKIEKIAYASMKGVDLSILRTNMTIAEFKRKRLPLYSLAPSNGHIGDPVTAAGVPARLGHLQISECQLGNSHDVVENNWHWYDVYETNCKGISGGSSGSPVFNQQFEVLGFINTTNSDAIGDTCYSGSPCIIDEEGAHINPNSTYIIKNQNFSGCFNDAGLFDLQQAHCALPKPTKISLSQYPYLFSGLNQYQRNTTWKIKIDSQTPIRYKFIHLAQPESSCRNSEGYSEPLQVPENFVSNRRLPLEIEGVHQLCITDSSPTGHLNSEVIQVIIDNTGATIRPPLNTHEFQDRLWIEPVFALPEYSDFWVGFAPSDELLDCEDADYQHYFRIPFKTENVNTRICVYGYDNANNKSQTFEYLHQPSNRHSLIY